MAIICWGNLAKSADDTQRIEQAIQDYVEKHDENPNAHMGEDYALGAHRLQTILDHPYGSIYPFHVYSLDAGSITTGAMVVKGGGPYIVVHDPEENERVRIYPEGIIVKEGKISVENEGNLEIIDGKGLRGSNIFYSNIRIKTTEQNITGNAVSFVLTPLEHGFYFFRNTPVLVFGVVDFWMNGNQTDVQFSIEYPDGYFPNREGWVAASPQVDSRFHGSFSFSHILQLHAGYNTVRLRGLTSTGDSDVYVSWNGQPSTFGYVVLGN